MKHLSEYINEGLFSAFKISSQITKVQGAVMDYAMKVMEEAPEKMGRELSSADEVLLNCKNFAAQKYKEIVTEPGAEPFGRWWSGFAKSFEQQYKYLIKK